MSDERISHEEARICVRRLRHCDPDEHTTDNLTGWEEKALSYIAQQESREPDGYVVEFLDIDGRVSNRLLANTWLAAKYATENVQYNTDLTRIRPFRYLDGDET